MNILTSFLIYLSAVVAMCVFLAVVLAVTTAFAPARIQKPIMDWLARRDAKPRQVMSRTKKAAIIATAALGIGASFCAFAGYRATRFGYTLEQVHCLNTVHWGNDETYTRWSWFAHLYERNTDCSSYAISKQKYEFAMRDLFSTQEGRQAFVKAYSETVGEQGSEKQR